MCQGSTGPWERTIVGEKQDGSPHHQADSPYTTGIVGLRRALPLSQVLANPSPPKPRECTESLLPGSLVIWLIPTLQDTRKTVPTTTARHPRDPCTPTHCLPPARRGHPAEPAVDSGPPLGAGFCTKSFISQITWRLGCPVLPRVQPCTSSLLFLGAASHPDEPREQRRQQVQTCPPRAGHIPSTLVASKNKKRNRVSGTSPFTSAQERRAPHVKAQRRRPPGAGWR